MAVKTPGFPVPFLIAAIVLTVAGGLVSAVNSAAPFDRGSWLAAYLVLVGGVAQGALACGRLATGAPPVSRRKTMRLLVLWNFGSLAVPLGVLADYGFIVGLGSLALIAALWLFAREVPPASAAKHNESGGHSIETSPWLTFGYLGFVAVLAVSVAIGGVLTDAPLFGTT